MCRDHPGRCTQFCSVFMPGLLGMMLAFYLGCFVDGADIQIALVVYLTVMNIISFLCYMIDKEHVSQDDCWRIAELALLSSIFLGGSFGVWLGMIFSKRKIFKPSHIFSTISLSIVSLTWVFYGSS